MNIDDDLNKQQAEAVKATDGPVLVLAGAGTGKTRVITYRIAHLIINKEVTPGNILAVTFTNKAAAEMKSRLKGLVGNLYGAVSMGTFHSICLNILRNEAEYAGLIKSFSVMDQEDRLTLLRNIVKNLNIDSEQYKPKMYLQKISSYKNTEAYVNEEDIVEDMHMLKAVYQAYQRELEIQRMVDFDDMIALCVRLFIRHPDILAKYKELYTYILVDEYQDTNVVQFKLLFMLAGENGNLCVVGDDDQSIYGWRGADIQNILNFDKIFKNVQEIKLEGNYRSGKTILNIANKLIKNNQFRRGKTLEASSEKKSLVKQFALKDEKAEAKYVASLIYEKIESGVNPSDIAILYRTNAQSNVFEKVLKSFNIAYKVVGSVGFYQRMEIKDIVSYLRFSNNLLDEQSFFRSITTPKRGIGNATIDKIIAYAKENNISILESLDSDMKALQRHRQVLDDYSKLIKNITAKKSLKEKVEYVIEHSNYTNYLKGRNEEQEIFQQRLENIDELISDAARFDEESNSSLTDFLASAALVSSNDEDAEFSVKLMTIHAAKGLEFKIVFLTGLEEGLFPLYHKEGEENKDSIIEEERRLCYVAVTRAMDMLYLSMVYERMKKGENVRCAQSRFFLELKGKKYQYSSKKSKKDVKNTSISENKEYNNNMAEFSPSTSVSHSVFGIGTVLFSEGSGENEKVTVHFKKSGIKQIAARFLKHN